MGSAGARVGAELIGQRPPAYKNGFGESRKLIASTAIEDGTQVANER